MPAIVAAILDEHRAANPVIARSFRHRAELSATYPRRAYTVQYRESDLAFIERLLAEEGISYRYLHGVDATASHRGAAQDDASTPQHTLVLFDANDGLPASQSLGVRFHRTDGGGSEDAIDDWQGQRQVQPGQTQLASFDALSVTTDVGTASTRVTPGEGEAGLANTLHDYDPQTERYGESPDELAGYQIVYSTWKEKFDQGLISVPLGKPRFTPEIQDRIAVMKIEDRKALHLVRAGKIEDAVALEGMRNEWTSLPGGSQNAHRHTAAGGPMNMAYFRSLFDTYLIEEKRRGGLL